MIGSWRRRWVMAVLLLMVGAVLSPNAVPIYDGINAPDEPYRYVSPPADYRHTKPPSTATVTVQILHGYSYNGFSLETAEMAPQFSLFVGNGGLAAAGTVVKAQVLPIAATDEPSPSLIDGNVYDVTLSDAAGPVRLTAQAATATIYMRATSQRRPEPTMYFRKTAGQPWVPQSTSPGGLDVYVASFRGAGQYALAFSPVGKTGDGLPVHLLVLSGLFILLLAVVLGVRFRAQRAQQA